MPFHNPATFLALGDSYTIGTGVSPRERWPVQLVRRLRGLGVPMGNPRIIAQNGWTTQDLMDGMQRAHIDHSFSLVTLLIGVNNQYQGEALTAYRLDFKDLLKQAIRLAEDRPTHVLVLSIPDWSITPFAANRDGNQIAAEIDAYNQVNYRISLDAGVLYVDVTSLMRKIGADPDMLAADGLHPSAKAYAAWMDLLVPKLMFRFS